MATQRKQRLLPFRKTSLRAKRWWQPTRLLQLFMVAVLIVSISPTLVLIGLFNKTSFAATASQGPRTATSSSNCVNTTGIGTVAWSSPGNAYDFNDGAGTYATASVDGTTTNYLRCTNFGFSIPDGVTIDGVQVGIRRYASSTSNGGVTDSSVNLVKGGVIQTTNRASASVYPTAVAWNYHGGSADLWGTTWTVSDINNSNFGATVASQKASGSGAAITAYVENINITVTYSFNPTFSQSSYQWFDNIDSAAPLNVGGQLNGAARNTATTTPSNQATFRLRLAIHVADSVAPGGSYSFRLQHAKQGTDGLCDTSFTGESYTDVNSVSTIAFANNPIATDGSTLAVNANDPQHGTDTLVRQSYEEGNTFALSNSTLSGQDALWDFALKDNGGQANTAYCFRVVTGSSALLNSYSVIPQITTPPANVNQDTYQWFQGQDAVVKNNFAETLSSSSTMSFMNIMQATDGSYVATGASGAGGVILAKFDSSGRPVWSTLAGTSGTGWDLLQTSDGGYIVTGATNEFGSLGTDSFIAKFSSSGAVSWLKRWGGSNLDISYSVTETLDGGYAVAGVTYVGTNSEVAVAKFDSAGNSIWQKSWGTSSVDEARDIALAPDGGFIVVGTTGSGGTLMLHMKLDSAGNKLWSHTVAPFSGAGRAYAVTMSTDGGYVLTGHTTGDIGGSDGYIAKFNSTGEHQWSRSFGGTDQDQTYSITSSPDGGYVVAGGTFSIGPSYGSGYIAKFTSSGGYEWTRQWATPGENQAQAVVTTQDGGYAVTAYNQDESQSSLLKYDTSGSILACHVSNCTSTPLTTASPAASHGTETGTLSNTSYVAGSGSPSTSSLSITPTLYGGYTTYADTYGGTLAENIHAMSPTADGGYVVVGDSTTYTSGARDIFTAKFNSSGALSWARQWGGTLDDTAVDIAETYEGNIVIAGNTNSYGAGGSDVVVLTYNSAGTLTYENVWGGPYEDTASAISPTNDGGKVVAGTSDVSGLDDFDATVLIFDAFGSEPWPLALGNTWSSEHGADIIQNSSDEYILTGSHFNGATTSYDIFVVGLDYSGATMWETGWGASGSEDRSTGIIKTTDDGFAVTGYSTASGNSDVLLLKFDAAGLLGWAKSWGSTGGNSDTGNAIAQTADGGYVISGTSNSSGNKALLLKVDSIGNVNFSKIFGNGGATDGQGVAQTIDGGYVTAGTTTSYGAGLQDMFVVKYDDNGALYGCTSSPCATISGSISASSVPQASSGISSYPHYTESNYPNSPSPSLNPTKNVVTAKAIWGNARPTVKQPLAAQNVAASSNRHDDPLRLRTVISSSIGKSVAAQQMSLKLQVAPKVGTCDASFTGEVYVDLGASALFDYYNYSNLTSGGFVLPGTVDPSALIGQPFYGAYYETSGFTLQHHLTSTQSEIVDIALTPTDSALYGSYCFRVANTDNRPLASYTNIAELTIPPATSQQLKHGQFFNEQEGTGLTPFYW